MYFTCNVVLVLRGEADTGKTTLHATWYLYYVVKLIQVKLRYMQRGTCITW